MRALWAPRGEKAQCKIQGGMVHGNSKDLVNGVSPNGRRQWLKAAAFSAGGFLFRPVGGRPSRPWRIVFHRSTPARGIRVATQIQLLEVGYDRGAPERRCEIVRGSAEAAVPRASDSRSEGGRERQRRGQKRGKQRA
jgi:hypothetical protein